MKLFNFFKKKNNIIADRIKALNDKLWLIYITGSIHEIENRIRFCRNSPFLSETFSIAKLKTIYGERRLAVSNKSLFYGKEDLILAPCNENSLWSFNFNYIFGIKLLKNDIEVLLTDVEMSKEAIDLAILEFENAVDSIYNDITDNKRKRDVVSMYLKEGH